MTLGQTYNVFKKNADLINQWTFMTKTQLANGYCDAQDGNDVSMMDAYFSALMCKYWYMIPYLYSRRNKGINISIDDVIGWVSDGLLVGFKLRSWKDPSKPISRDPKGAEKVFNQCITSTVQMFYRAQSAYKRKLSSATNYLVYSLDKMSDDYDEDRVRFDDSIDNSYEIVEDVDDSTSNLINYLVKTKKVIYALIIDTINIGNEEFLNKRKIGRNLESLLHNKDYIKSFSNNYNVDVKLLESYASKVSNMAPITKDRLIDKAISDMQKDKNVKLILC